VKVLITYDKLYIFFLKVMEEKKKDNEEEKEEEIYNNCEIVQV